jgi:hypothetical protein
MVIRDVIVVIVLGRHRIASHATEKSFMKGTAIDSANFIVALF